MLHLSLPNGITELQMTMDLGLHIQMKTMPTLTVFTVRIKELQAIPRPYQ